MSATNDLEGNGKHFCWQFTGHGTVTVTVTEALVLRPLLEDRGCITESIHILVHRQNETEMFSDHDETIPSIAAVLAPSVACSMLAVQKQHFITIFLFALAP